MFFFFFFFGEQCNMEVELGAFLWKGPIHPPPLSLTDLTKWFRRCQYPISHRGISLRGRQQGGHLGSLSTFPVRCLKDDRGPSSLVYLMCVFSVWGLGFPLSPAPSHLLRVHWALGALGSICVKPEDGLVAHGAHAADLQPLKQAPDGTETVSLKTIRHNNRT